MVIRTGSVLGETTLDREAAPTVTISSLPVFRDSTVGPAAMLTVEVDCPRTSQPRIMSRLTLSAGDTVLQEALLVRSGKWQRYVLPFPAFDESVQLHADLELRDYGRVESRRWLAPEKKWTFYFTFETHLDLGWTDRVKQVIGALRRMTTEDAVALCDRYADNPEDERFVWTCECSDALRIAFDAANAEQRRALRRHIEAGLIQSCVMPYTYHTSLMSRDLMRRALRQSFALRKKLGVDKALDLSVAQQADVPGHSWVLPDVLAEFGLRRMVVDHNNLVRSCDLPPVFRWSGPGGSEVLTVATSCVEFGGSKPVPAEPTDLCDLSINATHPLQMPGTAILRRISYGENCGPTFAAREIESIQAWNRQNLWPRLVIGSPKDYFEHVEPQINFAALPTVEREISDWWLDGPASMPTAMGLYRKAMMVMSGFHREAAPEDHDESERNLLLHAEHTFGLNAQLVRVQAAERDWRIDEGMQKYVDSWQDKEHYAEEACRAIERSAPHLVEPKLTNANTNAVAGRWKIEHDEAGITRLTDPEGHLWVDSTKSSAPWRFGAVVQRLVSQDFGDWIHHNPIAAPHAGDRVMQVTGVEPLPAPDEGVRIEASLSSPAGAIDRITITVGSDATTGDLCLDVSLLGKHATAQSEVLVLSLPFMMPRAAYRVDSAGTMMRVDVDQLPDANRDGHTCIRGWIADDGQGGPRLAVSSAELFLWHFGALRYGDFNRTNPPRTGQVYGHLLNNLWTTNFRCWIEGDLHYHLRLRCLRDDDDELTALSAMSERWPWRGAQHARSPEIRP